MKATVSSSDWRGRFAEAYRRQLGDFVAAVSGAPFLGSNAWDGYVASLTAEAARQALASGEVVSIEVGTQPGLYAAGS